MRKKTSTTVYLDAAQFERLKEISTTTHVPMAVLIREGVDTVLVARESANLAEQKLRDALWTVRDLVMNQRMRTLVNAAGETLDVIRSLREREGRLRDQLDKAEARLNQSPQYLRRRLNAAEAEVARLSRSLGQSVDRK